MLRYEQRRDSPFAGCGAGFWWRARCRTPAELPGICCFSLEQDWIGAGRLSAPCAANGMVARDRHHRARHHLWPQFIVIRMTLPWPPSVNRYWRHPTRGALAGRHLISEEGRRYRVSVIEVVRSTQTCERMQGSLCVRIDAYPPDRRRRDLDNILKSLLDSITHAGVIEDDSLIDDLHIVRRELRKNGAIEIQIFESEKL